MITTVAQTPLSHVNLRAIQDKVPNAFVRDALDDPSVTALIGRYVKYSVTSAGFTVAPATQQEVEEHHSAARPAAGQTPERDLTVRAIAALSDIGFADWKAYGVKAANVATLGQLELPDASVPDGYAVPFFFYDEFMKSNDFYDRVEKLLADPTFRSDPTVQERRLEELRQSIEDAPMPSWMVTERPQVPRRCGGRRRDGCRLRP